jgi:hypothetical protein
MLRVDRREFLRLAAAAAVMPEVPLTPSLAPQYSDYFRTYPLIGRVRHNSAVANLIANEAGPPCCVRLRYALEGESLAASPLLAYSDGMSGSLAKVEILLEGLAADQIYNYRAEILAKNFPRTWIPGQIGRFATQKPSGSSFRFCVVADAHWGLHRRVTPGGWRYRSAQICYNQIAADGPWDFMLDLGDSPHLERVWSYEEALEKYLHWRRATEGVSRQTPIYQVIGNHEREAGYQQRGDSAHQEDPLWNQVHSGQVHQKWATLARHYCLPNPRGDTYPEGGEGAPGYDTLDEWFGEPGPWNEGSPTEHLQNFYAFTWGDALFVVLDPYRYTLVGSLLVPNSPSVWTLGSVQMAWLADVLSNSTAIWKFVIAHHLVGGGLIGTEGDTIEDGGGQPAYGRGSAIEASRGNTEQAQIHSLMRANGAQFFLYGHDHVFSHSVFEGVHYICPGRPTFLNGWWDKDGMLASYGSILTGPEHPWMRQLRAGLGYMQVDVSSDEVHIAWIRTDFSYPNEPLGETPGPRDFRESWAGLTYPANPESVGVTLPLRECWAVRTSDGAVVPGYYEPPIGQDYSLPFEPGQTLVPLQDFPDTAAVADVVPELLYEQTFHCSD